MKLFFDTEFTGLRKDTTLISIGIISEDGRKFYAEFLDYAYSQVTPWIKENVIDHLRFQAPSSGEDHYSIASRAERNLPGNDLFSAWNLEMNGTKEVIREALKHWLSQFYTVQFVSDVCHYDFVLLVDLLTGGGTALDLPENISAVCHDINQDIAAWYEISDRDAFDKNREQILDEETGYHVIGDKHNSLYDAEIIREIYKQIGM